MKNVIKSIIFDHGVEIIAGIMYGTTIPLFVMAILAVQTGVTFEEILDRITDKIEDVIKRLIHKK